MNRVNISLMIILEMEKLVWWQIVNVENLLDEIIKKLFLNIIFKTDYLHTVFFYL